MDPVTVIFIGRSGSGKGTQAKLLMEELARKDASRDIFYLETGAKFREFFDATDVEHAYSRRRAKAISDAGGLQPEFITVWLWSDVLLNHMHGGEHLVFDGTPRKLHEAQVLHSAIGFYERTLPSVIFLNTKEGAAVDRLVARGRYDDQPEAIKRRMEWFDSDVMPIVDYYRENPTYRVFDIDGSKPVSEVQEEIRRAVFSQ